MLDFFGGSGVKSVLPQHGAQLRFQVRGYLFSSVTQVCPVLCNPKNCSMPGLPVHHQLQEFTQTHVHCVSDAIHLILCRPLLLLPSIFPSTRNISPSSEHPGLISSRMDWLDLLAVQGTLKSVLQSHSSKASILQCSALFILQLSYPYMITGKVIALTG